MRWDLDAQYGNMEKMKIPVSVLKKRSGDVLEPLTVFKSAEARIRLQVTGLVEL